jgi:hypothetical protein
MIAIAILSFGIVAVIVTVRRCVDASKTADGYLQALAKLERTRWELRHTGNFGWSDGDNYKIFMEKQKVQGIPFNEVAVTVKWQQENVAKEIRLGTWVRETP